MAIAQDTETVLVGGKRKLEVIAVYIPKKQKEALEQWASLEERSVSYLVGKLIDKALEEREAKQNQVVNVEKERKN